MAKKATKEYNYAYEKLIDENNLKISDLPEDAQTAIQAVVDMEKSFAMARKKGAVPTETTVKKAKLLDKNACREIADYLEEKAEDAAEKEKLAAEGKAEAKRLKDEADAAEEAEKARVAAEEAEKNKSQKPSAEEVDPRGAEIDAECVRMQSNSKEIVDMNYLREFCPTAYKLIFDTYEKLGDNGITTSNFSLIEIPDQREKFKLTKI